MDYKVKKLNELLLKARDLARRIPQTLWVDYNIKTIAFIEKWNDFELLFNRYAKRVTDDEFNDIYYEANCDFKFRNSQYLVLVYIWDEDRVWLCIKNHENTHRSDWRDKQRIKNELCGTTCEGVELYPCESRLVDSANSFHLFVGRPNVVYEFGWHKRDVMNKKLVKQLSPKANQREFEIHHYADKLYEVGIVWRFVDQAKLDKRFRFHKQYYI